MFTFIEDVLHKDILAILWERLLFRHS